jgi:hypothetical protein
MLCESSQLCDVRGRNVRDETTHHSASCL